MYFIKHHKIIKRLNTRSFSSLYTLPFTITDCLRSCCCFVLVHAFTSIFLPLTMIYIFYYIANHYDARDINQTTFHLKFIFFLLHLYVATRARLHISIYDIKYTDRYVAAEKRHCICSNFASAQGRSTRMIKWRRDGEKKNTNQTGLSINRSVYAGEFAWCGPLSACSTNPNLFSN